jgi:hypothetical protein
MAKYQRTAVSATGHCAVPGPKGLWECGDRSPLWDEIPQSRDRRVQTAHRFDPINIFGRHSRGRVALPGCPRSFAPWQSLVRAKASRTAAVLRRFCGPTPRAPRPSRASQVTPPALKFEVSLNFADWHLNFPPEPLLRATIRIPRPSARSTPAPTVGTPPTVGSCFPPKRHRRPGLVV